MPKDKRISVPERIQNSWGCWIDKTVIEREMGTWSLSNCCAHLQGIESWEWSCNVKVDERFSIISFNTIFLFSFFFSCSANLNNYQLLIRSIGVSYECTMIGNWYGTRARIFSASPSGSTLMFHTQESLIACLFFSLSMLMTEWAIGVWLQSHSWPR